MAEERKGLESAPRAFAKEQILASERYRNRRDLLDALLDGKKNYTIKEADRMVETFMKGRVK